MKKKDRATLIVEELKKAYPEGICSLQYPKPHELLFPCGSPPSVPMSGSIR